MRGVEVEGVEVAVGVARRPQQQQRLRRHHPLLLHLPSLVGRYLLRSGGGRYYIGWQTIGSSSLQVRVCVCAALQPQHSSRSQAQPQQQRQQAST